MTTEQNNSSMSVSIVKSSHWTNTLVNRMGLESTESRGYVSLLLLDEYQLIASRWLYPLDALTGKSNGSTSCRAMDQVSYQSQHLTEATRMTRWLQQQVRSLHRLPKTYNIFRTLRVDKRVMARSRVCCSVLSCTGFCTRRARRIKRKIHDTEANRLAALGYVTDKIVFIYGVLRKPGMESICLTLPGEYYKIIDIVRMNCIFKPFKWKCQIKILCLSSWF